MDFSSSQVPPSHQPSLKRSASHISFGDDPPHQDQDEESGDNTINTGQQKEWEDLSTSSIASVASEELHERRPNRWKGNPSTWRTWTKNERRAWESIENVRKADLSVHLYNAFALNKGVRKGPEERFLGGEGQNSGGWNVGSRWIAWPLPVDEVPGDDLLDLEADDGNGEFTFRRREGRERYSGRNLEEEVSATVLRLAKERFYRRVQRWKDKSGEERDEADVMQSIEQGDGQDAVGGEEDEDSDMEVGHDTAAGEEETDATGDAFAEGPKTRRLPTTKHSEATFTPVMSADDERNYTLIRPSAKRIMAQLDKTLMVLHHARAAAARDIYGFDTDEDEASGEEVEHEKIRDSKMDVDERPGRRKPRGRSRTRSRSRAGSRPARFRFRSRSRSNSSDSSGSRVSTKVSRIGLQNWRDVLGAAALAGFSPEVIARATQRCSNLFNEEMVIHTLPEQAVTSDKPTVRTTRYQPKLFEALSPLSDDEDYDYNEQLAAHRRNIGRQSTAAPTREPVNAPAPAAKRASTPAVPSRRSRSATPGASSTGGGGPHLCPFIDCNRAAEGFSRGANLRRHIRLVHKTEPPAVQNTDVGQDTEDELTGGIHTDGFLQPIKIRKGWRSDDAFNRERKVRTKTRLGGHDTDGDDDGGWESRS